MPIPAVALEWLSPETSGIFLGADGGRVAPTSLTRRGAGKLRLERQFCFEAACTSDGVQSAISAHVQKNIPIRYPTEYCRYGYNSY